MDALFVAGARYGSEKSCDQENLYLHQDGQDNVIPLASITAIRLAGRVGNGTRGTYSVYTIEYVYEGRTRRVEIAIYNRTRAREFPLSPQYPKLHDAAHYHRLFHCTLFHLVFY